MSNSPNVRGYSQAGDWLVGTLRRNPEALLLLAAGCALFMRTRRRSSSRSAIEQHVSGLHQECDSDHYRSGQSTADGGDRISPFAKTAEYASNIGNRVSETAKDYAESTSRFAQEAGRNVAHQSDRFRRKAQFAVKDGMKRVLREQPLAVGLAGLVAGAAVAAAFPRTEIENRTLGPAHDALTKAASQAGENLIGAAAQAGERLKTAAAERGFTAEGIKSLADDVSGSFSNAETPKFEHQGSAAEGPQGPSAGTGSAIENLRASGRLAEADFKPGERSTEGG
jgi:hypothetical protein